MVANSSEMASVVRLGSKRSSGTPSTIDVAIVVVVGRKVEVIVST